MKTLIVLLLLSLCCSVAHAQSGRGSMHGYVDFEGISYNDLPASKVRARVELRGIGEYNGEQLYKTETDEHGLYDFGRIGLGEFKLTISAPGYTTYETTLLIPSDFICNLATALKKTHAKTKATP
jgi:FlaG/FlaF family flagellin (archaellin)